MGWEQQQNVGYIWLKQSDEKNFKVEKLMRLTHNGRECDHCPSSSKWVVVLVAMRIDEYSYVARHFGFTHYWIGDGGEFN